MTIEGKIARDLGISGPFTEHDTENAAQKEAEKTGARVMLWSGTYAPPHDKGPIAFRFNVWVCTTEPTTLVHPWLVEQPVLA